MYIFIVWLIFSFLIAYLGTNRKIGFGGALAISLIFSPLIGLIFVLTSKDLQTDAFEKAMLKKENPSEKYNADEVAEHITNLKDARKKKLISEEEYKRLLKSITD